MSTQESKEEAYRNFRKVVAKRYYKLRNSIYSGIWPGSISNIKLYILTLFLLMVIEPYLTSSINTSLWKSSELMHLPKDCPRTLQALMIATLVGVAASFLIIISRQGLLRLILAYRGWMYENPKRTSVTTRVWYMTIKHLSGCKPSLYGCQRSLPRLPVPAVKDTLNKLYESLEPICTPEELEKIKFKGKEFENTLAPKLQTILRLKSWICQNYVSDWWVKYAYLMGRKPLPNNVNYYCCDQCYWRPTDKPASRAACLIHNLCVFKRLIDREELEPLIIRNTVPICMAQYKQILGAARAPGESTDQMIHAEDTKYIIVSVNGIYYKLEVIDSNNQILFPTTLEKQLKWIIEDAKSHSESYSEAEKSIASLTALNRTQWATIRNKHLSMGMNAESRKAIEEAICCVTFTDFVPSNLSEKGKFLLHGDGKSLWFDKSFNLIIFGNAAAGMNAEHTLADAPATCHMFEFMLAKEIMEKLYDENGYCMPFRAALKQAKVKMPQRLIWDITPELQTCIDEAVFLSKINNDDIDLELMDHKTFGKGAFKKCKLSPDGFMQMALQLAYFRDAKKFVQTYESTMTRLYQGGRTETVRSCTKEAKEFVLCMQQRDADNNLKRALLKRALAKHHSLSRDAMNGKGIDRHLFALYVACKGFGYESEFLHKIITLPWTLSTSQTPHTQTTILPDVNLPLMDDKVSPGGGFGPATDDGYGVSYVFSSDLRIFFHVTSKHSCPQTNSKRFLQLLVESMEDMLRLFETE